MIDTLVVGTGSAGVVLAARLSEDAGRTVCLVQAGPDYARPSLRGLDRGRGDDRVPLLEMAGEPRTRPRTDRVLSGRVMGGTSAINDQVWLRGSPDDFDGGPAAGNDRWAWSKVSTAGERLYRRLLAPSTHPRREVRSAAPVSVRLRSRAPPRASSAGERRR